MAGVTDVNDGIALAEVVPAAPAISDCASADADNADAAMATAPTHAECNFMAISLDR